MEKPKLQIALDCLSVEEALRTMQGGLAEVVDIIEVGTYLIIAEGIRAVGILRAAFPDKLMVADFCSTAPGFGKLVLEKGTQLNTLSAVMPDALMEQSLKDAKAAGLIGQISLYGDYWTLGDAEKWRRMGAEYIVCTNFHGKWTPEDVEKAARLAEMGYKVSIADGVTRDVLLLIPQLQYWLTKDKEDYFLVASDYQAYKEKQDAKENQK